MHGLSSYYLPKPFKTGFAAMIIFLDNLVPQLWHV